MALLHDGKYPYSDKNTVLGLNLFQSRLGVMKPHTGRVLLLEPHSNTIFFYQK